MAETSHYRAHQARKASVDNVVLPGLISRTERGKVKVKWTKESLAAHKSAGDKMRALGYRALREIQDPDCKSVFTYWLRGGKGVFQQTWWDTGDVAYWVTGDPESDLP